MAILTFEVKGQTLTVKSSIGRIVENSYEYLDFEILTSKDWVCNSNNGEPIKALSKKLMITTKEGTFEFFPGSYITKNVIIAPGFEASVIGYEAEPGPAPRQITTNPVFVSVCPSGRTEKTGDPPNTRPNISNIDAIAGQVTELRKELYGEEADGSIKEKTLEGSIESEIMQSQEKTTLLEKNQIAIIPTLKNKIKYGGGGWAIGDNYEHILIKITSEMKGKRIRITPQQDSYVETAFLSQNVDGYGSSPSYANNGGFTQHGYNVVVDRQIPENALWLYLSKKIPTKDITPAEISIDGYDYCEGVIGNLIKFDLKGNQSQINKVKNDIDNIKTQLSAKYKPFTTIVDNCQDIAIWTSKDDSLSEDEDEKNHIMWDKSLHCTGQMRCTQNTYDLLKNDLVLKLRINKIKDGHTICMRLSNTATPTEGATYYLMAGAQTTPYGDWREIVIPYSGYKYKSNNIDFSTINDIHIYADNVGTSGDPDGVADWNVQYIGLRPRNLNKGIISFTFDDGYKTQYTGAKLLAEKGITSTVYHIIDATGTGDILTIEELQEMVDYYNADIEVHGDIPRNDSGENGYNALTNEELIAHWSSSQKFLRENGLSEGRHMSYPGNYHSNRVVRLAKKYFDSCRTIQYYIPCESYPPADHHRLRAVTGVGAAGINVATVKKYIDQAMASGAWLILTFHRIGDVPQGQEANASMYCSESDLQAIADYAIESGAIIKNIAEVYNTTSIHL